MAEYRAAVSAGGRTEDDEGDYWGGVVQACKDPFTWMFASLHFFLIIAQSFKDFLPSVSLLATGTAWQLLTEMLPDRKHIRLLPSWDLPHPGSAVSYGLLCHPGNLMVKWSPPRTLLAYHRQYLDVSCRRCHHDLYTQCRSEILLGLPSLLRAICGAEHPDFLGDYCRASATNQACSSDRNCKLCQQR